MLKLEDRRSIIIYRIEKSARAMVEAEDNARLKHWNLVANRLYYATFHMASALLIDKGMSVKTHGGLIRMLGHEFVQKGYLSREEAVLASRLCYMRQSGDYDDCLDWTEQDIMPMFAPTYDLLAKLRSLITTVREK